MLLTLVLTEAVAIVLLGVLVAGLLRSHGEVLRTLHNLGAGMDPVTPNRVDVEFAPRGVGQPRAARINGETLDGELLSRPLVGERDTLLAFLSGGCESCLPFWQAFDHGVAVPGGAELLVVSGGTDRESETLLRRLAPGDIPVVMSSSAWEDFEVPGSPHFVYVDGRTGRVVGEGAAPTWPQVASLLERAIGDRRPDSGADAQMYADDRDDPRRVDDVLAAAGIGPGHSSLYADPHAIGSPADGST